MIGFLIWTFILFGKLCMYCIKNLISCVFFLLYYTNFGFIWNVKRVRDLSSSGCGWLIFASTSCVHFEIWYVAHEGKEPEKTFNKIIFFLKVLWQRFPSCLCGLLYKFCGAHLKRLHGMVHTIFIVWGLLQYFTVENRAVCVKRIFCKKIISTFEFCHFCPQMKKRKMKGFTWRH